MSNANRDLRKTRTRYEAEARASLRAGIANKAAQLENTRGHFQTFNTAALVNVALGHIDLQAFALLELANRGLNPATGEWVGFDAARDLLAQYPCVAQALRNGNAVVG